MRHANRSSPILSLKQTTRIMKCTHLSILLTPTGIERVSRAAEAIFSSANRPCLGTAYSLVPRCMHASCVRPASGHTYACVHCVYYACAPNLDAHDTHVAAHYKAKQHCLFLSVEHGRLFCVPCHDFVFNPFLDSAIELQKRISLTARRNFLSSPLDGAATISNELVPPQDSLRRRRSKRRRLMAIDHWIPTQKELSIINQYSTLAANGRIDPLPPVGLYNLGNSCYMNSVLQAFLNAPPLRCYFLSDDHRPRCVQPKSECLACAMDKLICDSYSGFRPSNRTSRQVSPTASPDRREDAPFLVPQRVLEIIWRNVGHLATYAQHDAHEFLLAALNLLNKHCRHPAPRHPSANKHTKHLTNTPSTDSSLSPSAPRTALNAVNSSSPPANVCVAADGNSPSAKHTSTNGKTRATSIVETLFSGTLQSDVICRACGKSSPTLEKFYDVSLDVDKVPKPPSSKRSRATSPVKEVPSSTQRSTSAVTSRDTTVAEALNASRSVRSTAGKDAINDNNPTQRKNGADIADDDADKPSSRPASFVDPENSSAGEMEGANTLFECLSRFTEPEMLGPASKMDCSTCGKREEAMKQLSIRSLPSIVSFHFKRFEQSFAKIRRSEMVKIDTPVEFPVDGLDLGPFQTSSVLGRRRAEAPWAKKGNGTCANAGPGAKPYHESIDKKSALRPAQDALYDLFAVVNHTGTIDSGHYTTLVRRNGDWYRCDDEKVTRIDPVEGTSFRSEEAYLVFYVQRKPNLQF